MPSVLFICHGNICRSPMAEFVMKDLIAKKAQSDANFDASDWIIESAATTYEEIGNDTHRGTKRMLDAHHIPYTHRGARHITPKDYERFDYLIGMDAENRYDLERFYPGDPAHKISLLLDWTEHPRDVADPWYTGNFKETYADVVAGCLRLLESLT